MDTFYFCHDHVKISAMEELYHDGYMSIAIQEDDKLLYYKITGYPKFSKIIRNGHDKIYEIVISRKQPDAAVTNIVADLLEAKILLTKDIKFIATTSYHRLAIAGVKNLAILLSGDIHVRINVEKTLEYMGPGIFEHVGLFSNYDEARNWLKNLNY